VLVTRVRLLIINFINPLAGVTLCSVYANCQEYYFDRDIGIVWLRADIQLSKICRGKSYLNSGNSFSFSFTVLALKLNRNSFEQTQRDQRLHTGTPAERRIILTSILNSTNLRLLKRVLAKTSLCS